MIGIHKPFNRACFNSNDPKCREVVINYMKSKGFSFFDNPDTYGVDLITATTPATGIEIERRSIWTEEEFPYPEINIPARKSRVLGNDNVHYCIVNNGFNRIGLILGKVLKKYLATAYENPNSSIKSGEYFFRIPREEFNWIQMTN